ncbi:MAG: hypothetical protein ABW073_06920 [Acidimicrobiia bacterium]
MTTIATLVGVIGLAGVASAGTDLMPPNPGCKFTFTINTPGGVVPPAPGPVSATITGAVGGDPSGVLVSLVLNGVIGPGKALNSDGSFTFGPQDIPVPVDISISYTYGNTNAYSDVCPDPGGQSVVRVRVAGEVAARARALAFTGSSDTTRNVLIGFAALMLGTVLVVGTRRRKHANA